MTSKDKGVGLKFSGVFFISVYTVDVNLHLRPGWGLGWKGKQGWGQGGEDEIRAESEALRVFPEGGWAYLKPFGGSPLTPV